MNYATPGDYQRATRIHSLVDEPEQEGQMAQQPPQPQQVPVQNAQPEIRPQNVTAFPVRAVRFEVPVFGRVLLWVAAILACSGLLAFLMSQLDNEVEQMEQTRPRSRRRAPLRRRVQDYLEDEDEDEEDEDDEPPAARRRAPARRAPRAPAARPPAEPPASAAPRSTPARVEDGAPE